MKKIIIMIISVLMLFNTTFVFAQADDNVTWMLSSDKTILKIFSDIPNYDARTAPWYKYSNQIEEVVLGDAVSYIGNYAFYNCTELSEISIPEGVTEIGYDAFVNCVALTSIDIPDSVTIIGSSAFEDCENIESFKLSENITKIYPFTFTFCKKLTYIEIPEGVEIVEQGAFTNCRELSEIYLPKSVEQIGNRVFYGCNSLDRIVYGGSEEDWDEISIGAGNDVLNEATITFLDENTDENEALKCYYCQEAIEDNVSFDYNGNIICFDCAAELLYEDKEQQEDYGDDEYLADEYYEIECEYCEEWFDESEILYDEEGYGLCPYCEEFVEGYVKEGLSVSVWFEYDEEYEEYLVYMEASDYAAEIYFTTDEKTPNKYAKKYSEPICVIGRKPLIRAIAYSGKEKSEIVNVWLTPEDSVEYRETCPYCMEKYTYDEVAYDDEGYAVCPNCFEVIETEDYEYEDEYYEQEDSWDEFGGEKLNEEQVIIKLAIGSNLIYINDEPVRIDAAPVIRNDRTMVPIRVIAEALGATVIWYDPAKTVCIQIGGGQYTYCIAIGEADVRIWDSDNAGFIEFGKIDSVAFIENERTYLPVRFVAEALGAEVIWDGYTQTITIIK